MSDSELASWWIENPLPSLPSSGIPDLPDRLFDMRLEAAVSAVNNAQGIDGNGLHRNGLHPSISPEL